MRLFTNRSQFRSIISRKEVEIGMFGYVNVNWKELSKERQIILFTCQSREKMLLDA